MWLILNNDVPTGRVRRPYIFILQMQVRIYAMYSDPPSSRAKFGKGFICILLGKPQKMWFFSGPATKKKELYLALFKLV